MNKKLFCAISLSALALASAGSLLYLNNNLAFGLRASGGNTWHHYERRNPTAEQLGIREYWVECGTGTHQFEEPTTGTIVDKGTDYDVSEFAVDDDRYFPFMMDEDHTDFSIYHYGAGEMDLTTPTDYTYYVDGNSTATVLNYKVYDQNNFKLDLPRVDFSRYNHVSMKFASSNYHGRVKLGLAEDDISYNDGIESNREIEGTVMFVLNGNKLKMALSFGTLFMSRNITDENIILGKASASIYVTALFDRFFSISEVTFDASKFVTPTYTFAKGAYGTAVYNVTANSDVTWLMEQTREGETTTASQLLYAGYDMNLMKFSLPQVDFELYNSVSMTLYVLKWNNGAKVGLVQSDVNYTSGNGDSTFTGHLSFVYNGAKLIADLDFGTVHVTADVTDPDVISGNASPLLFMQSLYNRQFIVRDFAVNVLPEIKLYNDWTVNKMGAFIKKGSDDITWAFGTYTTSSVLGYKSYELDSFEWGLPRINYSLFTKVRMDMTLTVWHNGLAFGLSSDDVTHYYTEGADGNGNINNAKATFLMTYDGTKLNVRFTAGNLSISRDITDSSVINGNDSVVFYQFSKYDRHADLTNITLGFQNR